MGEKSRRGSSPSMASIASKYINRGGVDIVFFINVLALIAIGLVMMFSASYPYANANMSNPFHYITRQVFFAIIGFVGMIAISYIRVELYKKLMPAITAFTYLLLLIVFVLPQYKAGFYRWIDLGFTTIQPSEVAKFTVVLVGACVFSKYASKINSVKPSRYTLGSMVNSRLGSNFVKESWRPAWIFAAIFASMALLVFMENHLSGFILIGGIGIVMMFLGGVRARWFVAGVAVVTALLLMVCLPIMSDIKENDALEAQGIEVDDEQTATQGSGILKGYMRERIYAWLDKDYQPKDARWQVNQALYAVGSGGLFGKGLGNSTQKYSYVSEPQNDMIFSIVCEELGFMGAVIIIGLFVLLIARGVIIGANSTSKFSAMLVVGIVLQVGLQVLLNIAVATDTIPNTGISLPFFSYGGTSLCMLMGEMGIVLSVSRESRQLKK